MKSKKEYLIKNKIRKEESMNKPNKKIKEISSALLCIVLFMMILVCTLFILKTDIEATSLDEKLNYASNTRRFEGELGDISLKEIKKVSSGSGGSGTLWMAIPWEDLGETGQLYCVEPGETINAFTSSSGDRLKAEYNTSLSELRSMLASSRTEIDTGCGAEANDVRYYLRASTTYFHCKNDHYTENDSFTDRNGITHDNLYDIAFELSWRESEQFQVGDWTRVKQLMVWDSILCEKDGFSLENDVRDITAEEKRAIKTIKLYAGRFISQEAGEEVFGTFNPAKDYGYVPTGYQGVMENIKANGDTVKKENGAKFDEDLYIDVDQKEKTVLMGPFSIDYIDCRIGKGDVSIGGISDMYLLDEKGKKINIDYLCYDRGNNSIAKVEVDNDHKYNSFYSYIKPDGHGNGSGKANINYLDFWAYGKIYPKPKQEFYIQFSYEDELPSSVKLHVDFEWLECKVELCFRDGVIHYINQTHVESNYHQHPIYDDEGHKVGSYTCNRKCTKTPFMDEAPAQNQVYVSSAERIIKKDSIEFELNGKNYIPLSMKIGGKVFEEANSGKENVWNGIYGEEDRNLSNIEVTLYEVTNNGLKKAKLATVKEENPQATQAEIDDRSDWIRRTNPTLTDEYGYYEFRGLNLSKKYVVMYTYNGQNYFATQYLSTNGGSSSNYSSVKDMVKAGAYSTVKNNTYWELTSKGTEITKERDNYTDRFSEIGSEPKSYRSTNNLKLGSNILTKDGDWYNVTFSDYDLMGYKLKSNGKYKYSENDQLIDGYLFNEDGYLEYDSQGNITSEWREGRISKEIKNFIDKNRRYPNDSEMKDIYSNIARNDKETWRKLQFIEDTKINAYTKNQKANKVDDYDKYPVYDKFTLQIKSGNKYPNNSYSNNNSYHGGSYDIRVTEYGSHHMIVEAIYSKYIYKGTPAKHWKYHDVIEIKNENVNYNNIYPGQLQVNLGLAIRQESDLALRKDLYRATTQINGKTEVYKYDKRKNEDSDYWEIQARVSDYDAYYNSTYDRDFYPEDINFNGQNGGNKLEVYVTYQIIARNQSQSTLNEIMEIVDYYDEDYDFMENLSWVSFDKSFKDDEYYDMMHYTKNWKTIKNAEDADTSYKTQYGKVTEYDLGRGYQNLYVRGLQGHKLESGESAYIYLTFKVKGEGSSLKLDSDNSLKYNYAEINGYKTYYRNGTTLPNYGTKGARDSAGLIDRDSVAGNLSSDDLVPENGRYEQNFEDDTDRSKGLKLVIDENLERKANGTVWEDRRTKTIGSALVGDGIRQDKEEKVEGVTVQLVEKCANGTEYIWQKTTTNKDGYYEFKEFIPGDYVVRFYYGDTDDTALTTENGGKNATSYNGQDFKSTTYQMEVKADGSTTSSINQDDSTDSLNRYYGYINTEGQNITGTYNPNKNSASPGNTYGYNIKEADNAKENYSDAKDLWTANDRKDIRGRQEVIKYSANNVTNHVAEVLASPYSKDASLYKEFKDNTYMTAETGIIAVEFEYDRIQTDGDDNTINNSAKGDNDKNGNYVLANVDFGLVERPKAQLEMDKSVANVKVTLANGSILFDINKEANNAVWKDHEEYSIDEEKKISSDNKGNVNKGSDSYYNSGEGDIIGMYEEYYGDKNKHRYSYREQIDKIMNKTDRGLIQLTMDEELMHGATIQVTYKLKVTNVGEVDYVDDNTKDFYYKGDTAGTTISTTTANQLVDYVQNNLQFDSNKDVNKDNKWSVITADNLISGDLVNSKYAEQLKQFNTIIQTETFGTEALVPGQETTRTLILSQLITPENEADDLTYSNMTEIVKTSNSVGRRMAYSVVGNQNPTANEPSEVDTSMAEKIVILPPFGEVYIYYIIGAVVAVLLIGGIILIKRKVLKGKDK